MIKKFIQSVVVKALEELELTYADRRVVLVTFNSNVYLIGDGKIEKTTFKINNDLPEIKKRIKREIECFVRQVKKIDHVGDNKGLLRDKVLEYVNLSKYKLWISVTLIIA